MRAHEFVTESKKGKLPKRFQQSTRGLHLFRDDELSDRVYELNRVMIAVACNDGIDQVEVPQESWVGRYNTAHPYTEVEQKKLEHAYKAIGSHYKDMNKKDLRSQELKSTNIQSPMNSFKGYKK